MKRNSCETCALMASLPQVEKEDDLRGEKIYAEFLIRNKKSNRIIDTGGPDAKIIFCALGSRHFKGRGVKCKHWIPALDLTISDAISIHLSRKMTWLTYIIIAFTISMFSLMLFSELKKSHQKIEIITHNIPQAGNDGRNNNSKEKYDIQNAEETKKPSKENKTQFKPKAVIPITQKYSLPLTP